MIVSAMMFVPHAGRVPVKPREHPQIAVTQVSVEPAPVPTITITTTFRLPPHLAYEALIQEAAAAHRVDPSLVREVVRAESAFDPMAVSSAGAQGLMQLMPGLSQELGVTDPFDPSENIFAGVRYLKWLLDEHDGNETLALASYNAGPATVAAYAGVPPFPETEHYVRTITGRLATERGAAPTPILDTPSEEGQ